MKKHTLLLIIAISTVFTLKAQHISQVEKERLQSIDKRVNQLGNQIFIFWLNHGPDKKYGGFYGTLDENGKPIKPFDKAVIAQSRHLWAFSTWYAYKGPSKEVKDICDNLYTFLITNFRDPESEEFVMSTDEKGKVTDNKKWLYSNSFAILGLAQYAKVFGNHEAAGLALQCFNAIDKRTHDPVNGGYNQINDNWLLREGANRETNTHIHLLESFTALYEVTHDNLVKARLEEMLQLVSFTLPQPTGYVHQQFKADWTPVNEPEVSYGHDLETSWLLYDAASVLKKTQDSAILKQIIKIGTLSGNQGYDAVNGGYFTAGIPNGKVLNTTKTWWIQAEALNGLLRLYLITGKSNYLDKIDKTLDWVENYQVNKKTGEWYEDIDGIGKPIPRLIMGHAWKASYHNLRAMMFMDRWIKENPLMR